MLALREALLDPEAYLRNSPPMAPARSLAPGEMKVDAKTVMAYAAQQQQAQQATQIGMAGAPLPLPAPAAVAAGQCRRADDDRRRHAWRRRADGATGARDGRAARSRR